MTERPAPPTAGSSDVALGWARAALSAVPVVGGPAVELLNLAIRSPLETRRNEYLSDLATRLAALEDAGLVSLKALSSNEVFADNVLHSTLAALHTRHRSKRDALRNAVVNSLLAGAPEADFQEVLIGLLDALQPWHLAILSLLARLTAPEPRPAGPVTVELRIRVDKSVTDVIEESFPELARKQGVYLHFVADLEGRGLATSTRVYPDLSSAPLSFVQVTALGEQLLAFIAEPEMGTKGGA